MTKLFAKETELVAAFCECLTQPRWHRGAPIGENWLQYHETAGWDLLLVHGETGLQIGIEAKLSLNPKVLTQALPSRYYDEIGPDYRAVLVPSDACQSHMSALAGWLGITVLEVAQETHVGPGSIVNGEYVPGDEIRRWRFNSDLPTQATEYQDRGWLPWLPIERCRLPDYVPDVRGGDKAPVALTPWKIKAIKLLILLERRGAVSRKDMKALDISATRWTEARFGYLAAGPNGYVRCERTPDLRAQHQTNWAEIEADFDRWNPYPEQEIAA